MNDALIKKRYFYLTLYLTVVSVILIIYKEFTGLVAWLSIIAMIIPSIVVTHLTRSKSIRIFILVAFFTQFIAFPWFFLNQESYQASGWRAIKSYSFGFSETLIIYANLAAVLFIIAVLHFFVVQAAARSVESCNRRANALNRMEHGTVGPMLHRGSGFHNLLIVLVILVAIPLNAWMFSRGISIVGIKPPSLPYRLSGILHYLTKYGVPIFIYIQYQKSNRSFAVSAVISFYAVFLGISQLSRSALAYALAPVMLAGLTQRKPKLLFFAVIVLLIGIQGVTVGRNAYYLIDNNSVSLHSIGASEMFSILRGGLENGQLRIDWFGNLLGIVQRIEAPQSIILGFQFDPENVAGSASFVKRIIYQPWVPLNLDRYHQEWMATTLPQGFVAGGGLLSVLLSLFVHAKFHFFLSAVFVIFMLVLFDNISTNMAGLTSRSISLVITLVLVFLLQQWTGTVMLWFSIIVLSITSWLLQIRKKCSRVNNRSDPNGKSARTLFTQ